MEAIAKFLSFIDGILNPNTDEKQKSFNNTRQKQLINVKKLKRKLDDFEVVQRDP
jgi:hypothetical protein